MNAAELNQRIVNLAKELREGEEHARQMVETWAKAERAYKRRQALARLEVRDRHDPKNLAELDARVELMKFEDGQTVSDLRQAAHYAEEAFRVAKAVVENRRQELSAVQTLGNLSREEALFARTAPAESLDA